MPKSKETDMSEQPIESTEAQQSDEFDPEPTPPAIPHHPDLIDAYDRHDYIAVDGQTMVAEFKFYDGSGIKAWTRDQGRAYATRHIAADGRALLRTGQARVDVEAVNAEIETLASERLEALDD